MAVAPRGRTKLRIEAWSNTARTIRIGGLFNIDPIAHEHLTNADRSRSIDTFTLSTHENRLPRSLTLDVDGPTRRGELYVRVSILWNEAIVQRLSAGYLTDGKTIAWPPGVFEGFTEGPGLTTTVLGTNPAANVEVSETVPVNVQWRIVSISFNLVSDATVINRSVTLLIDDGTFQVAQLEAFGVQEASTTIRYTGAEGVNLDAAGAHRADALPRNLLLREGYRLRTTTVNLQAGDDFGQPVILVEEWIQE